MIFKKRDKKEGSSYISKIVKTDKKAASQIDWIFSMSIFMLYLGWFFIFIIPSLHKTEKIESITGNINEILQKNLTWTVNKVPIIIRSNMTLTNEPIFVNYTLNWTKFSMINNNRTYKDQGNLIFLANLTKGNNVFWIVNSKENYTNDTLSAQILSTSSYAIVSSKPLKVNFNNGLVKNLSYDNNVMIKSSDYYISNGSLIINSSSYSRSALVSKYHAKSAYHNITTYIFAHNSRVYQKIKPSIIKKNITFSYELGKFSNYYANNLNKKTINYSNPGCESFNSKYVDFYSSYGGVTFYSSNISEIRICNTNTTIYANFTINLRKLTDFDIFAHSGNYNNTINKTDVYSEKVGAKEKVNGISINKTSQLKKNSYETIKKNLGITSPFYFILTDNNGASLIRLNVSQPTENDNVYVEKYPCWTLDKYANLKKCTFNIGTWQ